MEQLWGSTTYKGICVRAYNEEIGGRGSTSNVLPDITTLEPDRLQIVQDEIRMAEGSNAVYLDSDIIMVS